MKIAILGANGVYARHLLPRLATRGHEIRALVRRPEAAGVAAACGADVRTADIFDKNSLLPALAGCDIAINLATTLPGPSGRGDFAANDRLRTEGTPVWVGACREAGVARILSSPTTSPCAGAASSSISRASAARRRPSPAECRACPLSACAIAAPARNCPGPRSTAIIAPA